MKKKSLILLSISVFLIFVLASCKNGSNNNKITVFSEGKTNYSIVTASEAPEEAEALAEELADLSGAFPLVYSDRATEKEFEILIGYTNRTVSSEYVGKLNEASSATVFNFLIAESNGKIVIMSDADIGYIYALDYIQETYIDEDKFSVSEDLCEIKTILWDEYYASEHYLNRLTAEADKNRYENLLDHLDNEMNRYDEIQGNPIMTVEAAINQYKKMIGSFVTADFGEYTANTFINGNIYRTPTVYPEESHPRILFTANSIDSVRENLTASENSAAYNRYILLSDSPTDGKFKTVSGDMIHNYDADLVSKIEAKAFRYAMTGEEIYGYEAIYAVKNAILTINVPHTVGDWCRTYGHLMYVSACVYDWCYDLLTEADKAQIIAGGVNLLGMHLEVVCYDGATNKLPTAQGAMYGHGAEDQLVVDYFSFAIATYNEAPEIYELVAGRVLNDYVEAENYLYESGTHWEGSWYNSYRTHPGLMANIMVNKMTDGRVTPYTDAIETAIETSLYTLRPDGQIFRIGDYYHNENKKHFDFDVMGAVCFYAGNFYENERLKAFAYEYRSNFTYFTYGTTGLSPVQFLSLNNPEVSHTYDGEEALTRTTTAPYTSLFAKSANNDKNAFSIYMSMAETFAASHGHMECGSFQIFYKGILASESGSYAGWGSEHHMGYTMQSIASNSLMIYNPNLANKRNDYRETLIYTGGQSVLRDGHLPTTLEELLNHESYGQCTSLGVANVENNGKYLYSYMGGDMTKAYDSVTVGKDGEVTRYMFAVATGDKNCPIAFLTFDRITAADESYYKAALLHTQEEPTITNDGFAIITNTKNGNSGKLVVQSVGFDTTYTVWGGEGKEFWIAGVDENGNYSLEDGKNLAPTREPSNISEYGWGRIEISPKQSAETNYMLTVMYATDAKNESTPVKAKDISSENLSGAMIFGKAVLFPKNEKLLTEESSFTLTEKAECYVAGVSAGTWTVMKGTTVVETIDVAEGANLLTFTAKSAGIYNLVPAN